MYERQWPSVHWHFIELNLCIRLHSLMVWDLVTKELLNKGICYDMGQNDTIGKIELNPSFVLSSNNTNYKNDIQ